MESKRDVAVVPIFEPNRIPVDWDKSISPAFTKPITIASVAAELWITAVTITPTSIAMNRLLVIFSSNTRSLAPAASSRPSPINFIPNRNSPRPPKTPIISYTDINYFLLKAAIFTHSFTHKQQQYKCFIIPFLCKILKFYQINNNTKKDNIYSL